MSVLTAPDMESSSLQAVQACDPAGAASGARRERLASTLRLRFDDETGEEGRRFPEYGFRMEADSYGHFVDQASGFWAGSRGAFGLKL